MARTVEGDASRELVRICEAELGWHCRKIMGNMYQSGLPDLLCRVPIVRRKSDGSRPARVEARTFAMIETKVLSLVRPWTVADLLAVLAEGTPQRAYVVRAAYDDGAIYVVAVERWDTAYSGEEGRPRRLADARWACAPASFFTSAQLDRVLRRRTLREVLASIEEEEAARVRRWTAALSGQNTSLEPAAGKSGVGQRPRPGVQG